MTDFGRLPSRLQTSFRYFARSAGLRAASCVEIGEHRRAVVLAGPDREHAARRGLDGEAHDGLVDRADVADVEGAIGEPLADLGLGVGERHQAIEDAQQAAVGDLDDARRIGLGLAPFEEQKNVRVEQLAAAGADEAAGVALVDQAEQRQQPAPAAQALVHGVGVEGGVLGQLGVEAAQGVALLVERA